MTWLHGELATHRGTDEDRLCAMSSAALFLCSALLTNITTVVSIGLW